MIFNISANYVQVIETNSGGVHLKLMCSKYVFLQVHILKEGLRMQRFIFVL